MKKFQSGDVVLCDAHDGLGNHRRPPGERKVRMRATSEKSCTIVTFTATETIWEQRAAVARPATASVPADSGATHPSACSVNKTAGRWPRKPNCCRLAGLQHSAALFYASSLRRNASPARHASLQRSAHAPSVADGKVVWDNLFLHQLRQLYCVCQQPRQRLSCSAQERWPTAVFLTCRSSANHHFRRRMAACPISSRFSPLQCRWLRTASSTQRQPPTSPSTAIRRIFKRVMLDVKVWMIGGYPDHENGVSQSAKTFAFFGRAKQSWKRSASSLPRAGTTLKPHALAHLARRSSKAHQAP